MSTPSALASAMASGMLAAEVLPTVSMLKYSWSGVSPASAANLMIIVLLAWCGTIRSMLSSSVAATPSGSACDFSSSIICLR